MPAAYLAALADLRISIRAASFLVPEAESWRKRELAEHFGGTFRRQDHRIYLPYLYELPQVRQLVETQSAANGYPILVPTDIPSYTSSAENRMWVHPRALPYGNGPITIGAAVGRATRATIAGGTLRIEVGAVPHLPLRNPTLAYGRVLIRGQAKYELIRQYLNWPAWAAELAHADTLLKSIYLEAGIKQVEIQALSPITYAAYLQGHAQKAAGIDGICRRMRRKLKSAKAQMVWHDTRASMPAVNAALRRKMLDIESQIPASRREAMRLF